MTFPLLGLATGRANNSCFGIKIGVPFFLLGFKRSDVDTLGTMGGLSIGDLSYIALGGEVGNENDGGT